MNWTDWDVPGNGGIPQPGGFNIMTGVATGPQMFFKLIIQGN